MKKKIKQIIKIILSKKLSRSEIFENNLTSNSLIRNVEKVDNLCYEIELDNNQKVLVRNQDYSDYNVFKQVFNNQEYDSVLKMLKYNSIFENEKIIIDAGANVGFTSVYFANHLDNFKIFSVEPSIQNSELFTRNINYLKNSNNIVLYKKALCESENKTFEIERDFRDGKDWSITTKEVKNGVIEGITLSEIIELNKLKYISLLKIDIEGAERHIFNSSSDVSFLDITKIIALEIHDEFEIRKEINKILLDKDFFLFDQGELTIGVKKSIFQNE